MGASAGDMPYLESRIYGCLLGGLIGDAMGAPVEGWTYDRIETAYGSEGVTDFDGAGTDDTAIRQQLLDAIVDGAGFVDCDSFARTFELSWAANYGKWWVPVRNMAHKIRSGIALPVDAGYGNTASSSSAMAISPMGLLNAMNPRQAALETYDVAGLIHTGPSGFCRDAACAMAAAIAAAVDPAATIDTVYRSATEFLHPVSGQVMVERIGHVRALCKANGDYGSFRSAFYATELHAEPCDSRETVPAALALFELAGGDPGRAILYGANFGRDADTIATMAGGLAGAFRGAAELPGEWVAKVDSNPVVKYRELVPKIAGLVRLRARASIRIATRILDIDAAVA